WRPAIGGALQPAAAVRRVGARCLFPPLVFALVRLLRVARRARRDLVRCAGGERVLHRPELASHGADLARQSVSPPASSASDLRCRRRPGGDGYRIPGRADDRSNAVRALNPLCGLIYSQDWTLEEDHVRRDAGFAADEGTAQSRLQSVQEAFETDAA